MTTPAAGKVYRTTGAPARQIAAPARRRRRHAGVAAAGGDRLRRRARGAGDARRAGARRPLHRHRRRLLRPAGAAARRSRAARCRQTFELRRDGRPLLIERGRYDARRRRRRARAGDWAARACWRSWSRRPRRRRTPSTPCARWPRRRRRTATSRAATVVGDGDALVVRYLGRSAERARAFLHDAWRLLRPALLGRRGGSAAHLGDLTASDADGTDTPREGQAAALHRRAAGRAAQGARPQAQLSGGGRATSPPRSWKARATAARSPS